MLDVRNHSAAEAASAETRSQSGRKVGEARVAQVGGISRDGWDGSQGVREWDISAGCGPIPQIGSPNLAIVQLSDSIYFRIELLHLR